MVAFTTQTVAAGAGTAPVAVAKDGNGTIAPVHALANSSLQEIGTPTSPVFVGVVAGETHLGEIGGNVARFQATFGPAGTATQYSAGQVMGVPIEITNAGRVAGGTGMMMGATIVLNVANTNPIDLIFFNALPSAGAYTAGSTFSVVPADFVKISKAFHITDWTSLGAAVTLGEAIPSGKFYGCADGTKTQSLWVVPVARGNITLTNATDAVVTLRMSRN